MSNELKPRFSINRDLDGHPIYDSKTDEHYFNFDKLGLRDLLNNLDEVTVKPKIKLTKTLPSDAGRYYWCDTRRGRGVEGIEVVSVYANSGMLVCNSRHGTIDAVEFLGGHWAKVEQDHFEFEEG